MPTFLLFRLYGPLAAWGDVAVGERRPSSLQPSKSAVLGLVAACLGVEREDEDAHRRLNLGLGLAIRMDATGEGLRDFHTAQAPKARRGKTWTTRRAEMAEPGVYTILSARGYRADAVATAVLWATGLAEAPAFDSIAGALRRPHFQPYLGRKSCPPALPFHPQRVEANGLLDALASASFPDEGLLKPLLRPGEAVLFWESVPGLGRAPAPTDGMTLRRRDAVLSRGRWQFAERVEHRLDLGRRTETA